MILGVPHHHHLLPHPTVDIPPWPLIDDPTDESAPTTPVGGYLLSPPPDPDVVPDSSACDGFRIYEFKVRLCARGRSHDWTDCPFAHPGEKARRRDPRKFQYSGTACPNFRKGACRMGDACEFAHGVFECWLHPTRYRTQPCKDGINCRRKVCFFAHSADQLRVMKPPMSPVSEVGALAAAFRGLQLGKAKSIPLSLGGRLCLGVSHGFISLPATPTQKMARMGSRVWTDFIGADNDEGEPVMERVESGRDLRARMFERIRKGGRLDPVGPNEAPAADCPDVGWVSDLVR